MNAPQMNYFQMESTYYSYSRRLPFFKRLLLGKKSWSPYCGECQQWVPVHDRMLGLPVPEHMLSEGSESDIAKRLIDGDWSVLSRADPVHDWALQPAIFIGLGRCGSCDGPFSVLGEVHGQAGKTLYLGGIFLIEKQKESGLQLLETAIDQDLISNDKMFARAVDFCRELGSSRIAVIAEARQRRQEAKKLGHRGLTALSRGDLRQAESNLKDALRIFEELDDRLGQATACQSLGMVSHQAKSMPEAERLLKRSLTLFKELEREPESAVACGLLGTVYSDLGQLDRAETSFRQALEVTTRLGDKAGMAMAYGSLGNVSKAQGDPERAQAAYAEASKLTSELGHAASAD